ncbi:COG2192 Predicted carbamoyl transferase, NodU family [uncultured Caudovirales phage]|uniref:COG2192 Predicted carbamoyl transferase, NodU family n=1 Tax=uncultured Caudovirales phage TaxID=2100421 RepID=A0A6J5KXJ9_9CAUD|nr:COG2192 Predicted carbamoyl transferase, NodU family [uncultured Caudovirales phage]CAB5209325.1 COG2192 Predicted carbamoyl transferase, NodU family [uncultured Caudovirales phage]
MISWGISANSHDAALAVFVDEKLVFASHSERFSGIKNDRDLCDELVQYARQWGEPDRVYWYENPYLKTARQLYAGQGWKLRDNNVPIYLARFGILAPVEYTTHHRSHAATGYYTSGFSEACVLVIDAIGEFETMTIWKGTGNKLKKLWSQSYPHSIGLFYSAMTQRVGLKPNEDEYILMGMAAYGDYTKLEQRIKQDFIDPNFKFKKNLHRGCMDWAPDLIIKDSFEIAASVQSVYEELFYRALMKAQHLSKSQNLVLVGGCALNCSANRLTGRFFDNTWIYPNPGDAGSAIGAVLAKHPDWKDYTDWNNPFLGYDMGSQTRNEKVVENLKTYGIVGLARGKAEFGPRALGNRSLLADPRGIDIKDKVNEIKQRQQFRPFAPAILEEFVDEYFDMPHGWNTSRYMQVVARCRLAGEFPAIVHKDGTSRVQTVPNDGSPFRKLLELWYEETGCPMLLNTSLNIKGQPMVNNRDDAKKFERQYGIRVFN